MKKESRSDKFRREMGLDIKNKPARIGDISTAITELGKIKRKEKIS